MMRSNSVANLSFSMKRFQAGNRVAKTKCRVETWSFSTRTLGHEAKTTLGAPLNLSVFLRKGLTQIPFFE